MNPFIGEIRMFGGNFAPIDWQLCDGSLLSISTYNALYSLLGTTWGGDGINNFAVPDLRGRVPVGQGQGIGLSPRTLGANGGAERVALLSTNLPPHTHSFFASTDDATATVPGPSLGFAKTVYATAGNYTPTIYAPYATATPVYTLDPDTISNEGGNAQHTNLMPSTVINFIIATVGIFPSRS